MQRCRKTNAFQISFTHICFPKYLTWLSGISNLSKYGRSISCSGGQATAITPFIMRSRRTLAVAVGGVCGGREISKTVSHFRLQSNVGNINNVQFRLANVALMHCNSITSVRWGPCASSSFPKQIARCKVVQQIS